MAYFPSYKIVITLAILLAFLNASSSTDDQLSTDFYSKRCPKLLEIVKGVVEAAINKEARMGASLLRLHFHDCFVNGCDGSVLLDDDIGSSLIGEKNAAANKNSARGFEIIDQIKEAVEKECPGNVSCADILAIAARDSVCALGGPEWKVMLGRRDATTASQAAANGSIPAPTFNVSALVNSFAAVGLNTADLVVLSGAHTIGLARCTSFRDRFANETMNLDKSKLNCSKVSGQGDNNLTALDHRSPYIFDNAYYQNLRDNQGLLHSDQQLNNNGSTNWLVQKYSSDLKTFPDDFAKAMIKMGNIRVLTGKNGEIRKNCRKVNGK